MRTALLVTASGMVAMVVSACLGVVIARSLYAARGEVLLNPVHTQAFEKANRELGPAGTATRVVLFGDSRIRQWQPLPRADGVQWVGRGISGETTAQMTYRFRPDVLDLAPDALVIQAGINDVIAGVATGRSAAAVASAASNIEAMVKQASSSGIRIVLMTVVRPARPPIWRLPFWSGKEPRLVEQLNARLRSLSYQGLTILDADTLLASGKEYLPRAFAADTLHFTESAYSTFNAQLPALLPPARHAVQ